jgi:hypothetical protein
MPDSVVDAGIAGAILFALAWFIDRRIWPWFSKEYWPHRQKMAEQSQQTLQKIEQAIAVIQNLADTEVDERSQLVSAVNRLITASSTMNKRFKALDRLTAIVTELYISMRSNPEAFEGWNRPAEEIQRVQESLLARAGYDDEEDSTEIDPVPEPNTRRVTTTVAATAVEVTAVEGIDALTPGPRPQTKPFRDPSFNPDKTQKLPE